MNRHYHHPAQYRSTITTTEVDFASGKLPLKKDMEWIQKIEFSKTVCKNNDVRLELARFKSVTDVKTDIDEHGMATDSWWIIKCENVPDRILRLFRGSTSMTQLLSRYGFMDSSGCIHHRHVVFTYCKGCDLPSVAIDGTVPEELSDATGIPQFFPKSGICWFNTMCWTSFANPKLRQILLTRMHRRNRSAAQLASTCLFKRDDALKLRILLFTKYGLGDNTNGKPEDDGRNGCSEFTLMCARLGVPIMRYKESGGKMVPMDPIAYDYYRRHWKVTLPKSLSDEFILVFRFHESDHKKYRIYPRISFYNEAYDLCGMYLGQSKCGHQIGVAATSHDWRGWSVADADMHKDGIGPIFFRFEGDDWADSNKWWDVWQYVIHVTKFGVGKEQMCNHSPHNPGEDGHSKSGNNSVDLLYMRSGTLGFSSLPPSPMPTPRSRL